MYTGLSGVIVGDIGLRRVMSVYIGVCRVT